MCIWAGEGQSAITKTLQMYVMIYRALFTSIYISKIGNPNFRPFQFDLRTRSQKMCEKYDKNDKLDLTTAMIIHKKSYKMLGLLAVHTYRRVWNVQFNDRKRYLLEEHEWQNFISCHVNHRWSNTYQVCKGVSVCKNVVISPQLFVMHMLVCT